jgi:alkylation response protein AidB-like acyl-CoA dehydrogenase
MGLKALYKSGIRLENVRVLVVNVVDGFGRGLKVVLTTMTTGRINLPAAAPVFYSAASTSAHAG